MTEFKWQVAVLDDRPTDDNIGAVKTQLRDFCDVHVFSHKSTEVSALANAEKLVYPLDLILVDMIWEGFIDPIRAGYELDETVPAEEISDRCDAAAQAVSLPSDTECDAAACGDAQRAQVVQGWFHAVSVASNYAPKGWWVRQKIDKEDCGLWIAALCSHIEPQAELLLYSEGADEVRRRAGVAPWLRFRQPPLRLVKKTANGVPPKDLLDALGRAEGRLIEKHRDLRLWAQEVWIRACFGSDPASIQPLREFWRVDRDGNPRKELVRCEVFFPQFRDRAARAKAMKELWSVVSHRTPAGDRAGLQAAKHELENFLRKPQHLRSPADADRCSCALGNLGNRADVALDAFRKADYERVIQSIYSLRDGVPYIQWKTTIGNEAFRDLWSVNRVVSEGTWFPTRERFPISVKEWDIVQTAVESNGHGEFQVEVWVGKLEISFSGQADFGDFQDFQAKVLRAFKDREEDGLFRGWPAVIEFAISNGATVLEVLIKGVWHDLITGSTRQAEADGGFGARFVFSLEG